MNTLYLLLNTAVITALLILPILVPVRVHWRAVQMTFAIMLAATLFFDSLIIIAGIVDYDPSKILGVNVARAPIEDFAYTIAAAFFVPYVWELVGKKR